MDEQSTPHRSVALAGIAVLLALVAFAGAFYVLDGMSVINAIIAGENPFTSAPVVTVKPSVDQSSTATLQLPPGMTQDFALRLWQEQIDSQGSIEKLLSGQMKSLRIYAVDKTDDVARISVTASFEDSTTAPGVIGMRRFGDTWYLAYVTGMRAAGSRGEAGVVQRGPGGEPTTPLPTLDEVDIPLLNAILAENTKSKAITQEYVDGAIAQVNIDGIQRGPETITVHVDMNENHEHGYGQIVAIHKDMDGRDLWFLARLTKTSGPTGP
jgi:hypothetical protein